MSWAVYMGIHGCPWVQMEAIDIHGPWASMDTRGYPQNSMDCQGDPEVSMDIHAYQGILGSRII